MLRWLRLTFLVPPAIEDEAAVCLHEQGSVGVECLAGRAIAWFAQGLDALKIAAAVKEGMAGVPAAEGVVLEKAEEVDDGAWHERWVAGLSPISAGRTFIIIPGPIEPPAATGRRIIRLAPGRAFGTGEHGTTRMCLQMLESVVQPGDRVLDVGTGSGILAIASVLAGAERVVALDIDPDAVDVARRNAAANRIEGILLMAGTVTALRGVAFEIVAANVNGPCLVRLMKDLAPLTTRDLILSGILREEAEEVADSCGSLGFVLVERLEEGDWVGLSLKRNDPGKLQ